jgi:hypothetical protein
MHQLLDLARTSFDASDRGLRVLPTIVRNFVVAVTVFVLVWLLKPDLFGLVPNSLDPMFYTGYAINLDDALAAAGNRHYFVTRWTSYMPMYLFSEIFGPYWGRLVLRLAMILVLSEMFWRFGSRLAFPTKSRLLGIFTVITAPMFVRAFTTDYPEHFIIWGSMVLCLLVVSFADEPNIVKSVVVGVLAVSLLIANPFTSLLLVITLTFGALLAKTSGVSWRQLIIASITTTVTALAVLVVGYFQFKNRYAIGNVYKPTLDFMREYKRPAQDGWTAPSKEMWLNHFSWLYLSPILIFLILTQVKKCADFKKRAALFLGLVALMVFAIHIYVEIRRGNALETSYYWSMSLGPVLVTLYFLSGELSRLKKAQWSALSVFVVCMLLFWRIPQQVQLPAGKALFVVLVALILIFMAICRYISNVALVALLAIVLWSQIGAPTYSQRSYGGDLNSPRYDLVFRSPHVESDLVLHETIWFLNQMDQVRDDWQSTFLTAGGWSAAIVGTYIPHPFSRWIVPVSEERILAPNVRDELEFGHRKLLVIYGDGQQVEDLYRKVRLEIPRSNVLLDETSKDALGYRLLVLRGNISSKGEATIPLSRFDRQIGSKRKDGSVFVASGSSEGFVSFGPYFGLGNGSYTATLEYSSSSREPVGYFEVFNDVTKESFRTLLNSRGTGLQRANVSFEVSKLNATWQIRTVYSGRNSAIFHRVILKMSKES